MGSAINTVPFPLAVGESPLANTLLSLNEVGIKAAPRLCSFQFFLEVDTPANLNKLIEDSHLHVAGPGEQDHQAA